MTDKDDYADEYEDDFDPDEFDEDSLPYVSSYSENAPHNLWPPMLAAGLLAAVIMTAAVWYTLSSKIDDMEARLDALARIPAGIHEHQHPVPEELLLLQSQLGALENQMTRQGELLEMIGDMATKSARAREVEEPSAVVEKKPSEAPVATQSEAPVEVPRGPGKWLINLGAFGQESRARKWADDLTADGYPIEVAAAESGGSTVYRVRVTGIPSKDEAQRVVKLMQEKHELKGPWVSRDSGE